MRIYFFCLFFLTSVLRVAAQGDFRPGYIITLANDSVPGYVKYKNRYKLASSCEFRREPRGNVETYLPKDIRAYGFIGNKRLVSREVEESGERKSLFLDQLVLGNLSLLRSVEYFYLEGDSLLQLLPPTERVIYSDNKRMIHKSKPYQGQLNYVLIECQISGERTGYDESSLTAIVQAYNRCKGSPGMVSKQRLPLTKLNLSVFSGVHGSKLIFDNENEKPFPRDWSPLIGGGIQLSSPRIFDRCLFSLEGFYTQKKYVGTITEQESSQTTFHEVKIDFPTFQLAAGLQYNFWSEHKTPYLKLAYCQYLNGKGDIGIITETELNGTVITESGKYEYTPLKQGGIVFAVGYQRAFRTKLKYFGEIRYERTAGIYQYGDFTPVSSVSNLGIFVGLSF